MDCDLQTTFNDQIVALCADESAECVTNEKGEYIIRHDGKIWVFIFVPDSLIKN